MISEEQIREDIFGWFDSPSQETPVHDPGLNAPCAVCGKTVGKHTEKNPIMTISLCVENVLYRDKSYFFRVHKPCWKALDEDEQCLIESSLIDKLNHG